MSRRRARPIVLVCGILAGAGTLGIGALVGFGVLGWGTGLQVLASGAVLGAAAVMSWQLRRSNRHLRTLSRRMDRQVAELAEIAGENRAELFARADEISARLTRLERAQTIGGGSASGERIHVRIDGPAGKSPRAAS